MPKVARTSVEVDANGEGEVLVAVQGFKGLAQLVLTPAEARQLAIRVLKVAEQSQRQATRILEAQARAHMRRASDRKPAGH